jgi:hypothetical protein
VELGTVACYIVGHKGRIVHDRYPYTKSYGIHN